VWGVDEEGPWGGCGVGGGGGWGRGDKCRWEDLELWRERGTVGWVEERGEMGVDLLGGGRGGGYGC